jgi:hypothetical protein
MARLRGEAKRAWESSVRLYEQLRSGSHPRTVVVPDIDLDADEVCVADCGFILSTPMRIERTVTYTERQRPFTLNPMRRAREALERAADRAEFERLSREAAEGPEYIWTEQGMIRAVLTNQRIICDYEGSRFEYYHEYLTGLAFAIDDWTIDLSYEGVDPIRLVGLDTFAYGLLLTWLRDGPDALAGPGFEPFQS